MQQIYFGRMLLYPTHLVAQGWTWRGRYQQRWTLDCIAGVEWLHNSSRGNLVLKFKDGQRYFVTVKGPGTWHFVLRSTLKRA